MATTQQHKVDNQPLATFWDLPFSQSDASISRKSRPGTILKAAVYPGESWEWVFGGGMPFLTPTN